MKMATSFVDSIKGKSSESNSKINLGITVFVFIMVVTELMLSNRLSVLTLCALTLVLLVAIYTGSITGLVVAVFSTFLTTSVILSVLSPFLFLLLNPVPFFLLLIIVGLAFLHIIKKSIEFQVPWQAEVLSIITSIIAFSFVWNSRLASNGGPVAALMGSEDNAGWITVIQKVIRNNYYLEGGGYGSLLDSLLLTSLKIGEFILPDLSHVDHLALSVVILQIFTVVVIPFLPRLANSNFEYKKSTLVSSTILSLTLIISFRTFNQYGHLTASLACLLLSVSIVLGFQLSDYNGSTNNARFNLYLRVTLIFLAGITWYPIAPLAILLICVSLWQSLHKSDDVKKVKVMFVIFGILLTLDLVFKTLLQIPRRTQQSGESLITSAKNLLSFEGGVNSIEPWSVISVIVLAIVLLTILGTLKIKVSMGLFAIASLLLYSSLIKLLSAAAFNGSVTYGARKVELLAVLCCASFLTWAFVILCEIRLRDFVVPLVPGSLVLAMVMLMPGAGAIAGGKYFAGFESEDTYQIAKSMSKNIKSGEFVVCLNEAIEEPMGGPLTAASYFCTRFSAAFSFSNDDTSNWRAIMSGSVPEEMFEEVREQLPRDTKLIVVGPTNPDRETNNPNWNKLVDENWTIVR